MSRGRRKNFDVDDIEILKALIDRKSDRYLDELVAEMEQRTGKVVSIPTLWWSFELLGKRLTIQCMYLLCY